MVTYGRQGRRTSLTRRMDVVNTGTGPLAQQARRWRTALRIGLPLGGVGLIIGFLPGIALHADGANRAGVLGLSDTLLREAFLLRPRGLSHWHGAGEGRSYVLAGRA